MIPCFGKIGIHPKTFNDQAQTLARGDVVDTEASKILNKVRFRKMTTKYPFLMALTLLLKRQQGSEQVTWNPELIDVRESKDTRALSTLAETLFERIDEREGITLFVTESWDGTVITMERELPEARLNLERWRHEPTKFVVYIREVDGVQVITIFTLTKVLREAVSQVLQASRIPL